MPEVNKYCRGLPFLLIGCKSDLRTDEKVLEQLAKGNQKPVTFQQVSRNPPPPPNAHTHHLFLNPRDSKWRRRSELIGI